MLAVCYDKEGRRLCFGWRGGSVWWENLKKIRTRAGLVNGMLLVDYFSVGWEWDEYFILKGPVA